MITSGLFASYRSDWRTEPYSPYLIRTLRKAIERGRLRER